MDLSWMLLANHAESPNGLLYLSGAGWDTVNVEARSRRVARTSSRLLRAT
jgi:hypothetical protein